MRGELGVRKMEKNPEAVLMRGLGACSDEGTPLNWGSYSTSGIGGTVTHPRPPPWSCGSGSSCSS